MRTVPLCAIRLRVSSKKASFAPSGHPPYSTDLLLRANAGAGARAGDAGAEPINAGSNPAGVPDWLAEVAGPAAASAGGGCTDANNPGPAYDDSYYGQGYEGYEDYEGYYEGYDEGYYYQEAGYGTEDAGAGAGAGTPAATPPPTSAGGAAAGGGGGGLSWLTDAAGTVDAVNAQEEGEA